jgi:quercetin 2,3-dioxygenase
MITLRRAAMRGHANLGWLDTWHSFSFDSYDDPAHVQFGPLRVLNEDFVAPGAGFPPHPHRDMEIITLVLEGAVAHQDSSGGQGQVRPGDVQVMTAGTGVVHSEFNPSETDPLHLLQIWITPDARGRTPRYDQKTFAPDARKNTLLKVVSGGAGNANGALRIHQDATLYVSELDGGRAVSHALAPGRRAYLFVTRGAVDVNGQRLGPSDAAQIENEREIRIEATAPSGLVLIDLP